MAADDVAGLLAKVTSTFAGGGEERPGQLEMANAVARAIDEKRHVVAQAGTGTGKSLAYVVPAVASGRKVVVATATKALQDQLAGKDLPAVVAAFDVPVSFAVLKGRSNYLCRQRANEVDGAGFQQALTAGGQDDEDEPTGLTAPDAPTALSGAVSGGAGAGRSELDPGRLADQVRAILSWAAKTDSGDRGDLPFEPHPRAWAMLSVGPRECPGAHRCPEGARCFAEQARDRAAAADVVIVNTHLYGAHLASGGNVLPPHDVVVFDEAHEVEDVMTASLGVELAPGRLRALQTLARPFIPDDAETGVELASLGDRLRGLLAGRSGQRVLGPAGATRRGGTRAPRSTRTPTGTAPGTGTGSSPGPDGEPVTGPRERPFFAGPREAPVPQGTANSADQELADLLSLTVSRVERLRSYLMATDGDERAEGGAAPGGRDGARREGARRTRAVMAADHLLEDTRRLSNIIVDEVAWVDGLPSAPVLRLSPIDVGPTLTGRLWPSVTAVLTSATIPPRLTTSLGLEGFALDTVDVGSPFDYRSNSILYVARHLPDPRKPGAEAALHGELEALIEAAGGRTLGLFTSRRATEAAAQALRPRLPYRLLVQGELPKSRLLDEFAADETSCLFATLGFWQGVDIPGRALSLVTLDRLPFGRPDDPLLEARRDKAGDAAFQLIDLPRAATLLAQGVGRLIRSATDTGVVAVLDPRLATSGYRRSLLDALPPMRRSVDRAEVVAFFDRVLRGGEGPEVST